MNQKLSALRASDQLSRRGLILAYNAVRLEQPKHARRLQGIRYAHDAECFLYPISFRDKGEWRRFVFYINDIVEPGLLIAEDVDCNPK